MAKWEYTETELWRHGEDGISILHVFGLVSLGTTVLAFCEARYGDGMDSGCPHDIWMRRSTDGGKSFEPTVCLVDSHGERCLTDPTPIYDAQKGRLFLFYSQNTNEKLTENYLIYSDDEGLTWSEEKNIFELLHQNENPMPLNIAGPGHGIQIQSGEHAGRLVMPYWHRRYGVDKTDFDRQYCLSVLYSDDHGENWTQTEYTAFSCLPNESCICETKNGLLRSIRGGHRDTRRFFSRSTDGGKTWNVPQPAELPAAVTCQAGLTSFSASENWEDLVLISRIHDVERRFDMELLLSRDGGNTFPVHMALPAGDVMPGYSDLCVIAEEEPVVGLLHCRFNHVLFSRVSLQTITGGSYENTKRNVWNF